MVTRRQMAAWLERVQALAKGKKRANQPGYVRVKNKADRWAWVPEKKAGKEAPSRPDHPSGTPVRIRRATEFGENHWEVTGHDGKQHHVVGHQNKATGLAYRVADGAHPVVDEHGAPVPPSEIGSLWARHQHLADRHFQTDGVGGINRGASGHAHQNAAKAASRAMRDPSPSRHAEARALAAYADDFEAWNEGGRRGPLPVKSRDRT